MKLYALLTFLLALPLFVRLLPESADDSSNATTQSSGQLESPAPTSPQAKAAEKPAPVASDNHKDASESTTAHSH